MKLNILLLTVCLGVTSSSVWAAASGAKDEEGVDAAALARRVEEIEANRAGTLAAQERQLEAMEGLNEKYAQSVAKMEELRERMEREREEFDKSRARSDAISAASTRIMETRAEDRDSYNTYLRLKSKQRDSVCLILHGLDYKVSLSEALDLNEARKSRGISVEAIIAENKEKDA